MSCRRLACSRNELGLRTLALWVYMQSHPNIQTSKYPGTQTSNRPVPKHPPWCQYYTAMRTSSVPLAMPTRPPFSLAVNRVATAQGRGCEATAAPSRSIIVTRQIGVVSPSTPCGNATRQAAASFQATTSRINTATFRAQHSKVPSTPSSHQQHAYKSPPRGCGHGPC